MNSFGQQFRISIYGESHGNGIGVVIDNCPVGIELSEKDFEQDILRRKSGKVGTTARIEEDIPYIISGVFEGRTTGAPINIMFKNNNTKSKDYSNLRKHPRPGHSDYVANEKYHGFNDIRGGGMFSGRITLALVAAGVVAKKILKEISDRIEINAMLKTLNGKIFEDSIEMEIFIKEIQKEGDSVGGVIECVGKNIPNSLGEPFFDSVESVVSHLIFSIPGIRGIEFGRGFESTFLKGSECNDRIENIYGKTFTNNCGGINGGITNGNDIVFRVAVKPTSSIFKPQETFSFENGKVETLQIKGRHDAAFVLRVPVIVETCLAIAMTDLYLRNRCVKI